MINDQDEAFADALVTQWTQEFRDRSLQLDSNPTWRAMYTRIAEQIRTYSTVFVYGGRRSRPPVLHTLPPRQAASPPTQPGYTGRDFDSSYCENGRDFE